MELRLFIAINFDEDVKDHLCDIIQKLKSSAERGNFTQRENLHLTLAFLGEVVTSRVREIQKVMDRVSESPFNLGISGLGSFKRNGGDICWMGVERNDSLISLHSQLYEGLTKARFVLEKRAFKPHLTLGREVVLGKGFSRESFTESLPSLMQEVNQISLMKSQRINGKLTYTEVYKKSLFLLK